MVRSIDMHCHLMGFDGYVNPNFSHGIKMRTYLKNIGLLSGAQWAGMKKMPSLADLTAAYIEKLSGDINDSSLDTVVVIAMDGVYSDGLLDKAKTTLMVTNDSVFDFCSSSSKSLPGISINPLRKDWEEEFDRCLEKKPALIKWLPSVMGFDPSDKSFKKFYEKVVDADLTILTHVGFEYAITRVDDSYSDLEKLKYPLDMGVKMIAAHCCGGRIMFDDKKSFSKMKEYLGKYENIYVDNSGMTSVHRKQRLVKSLKDELVMSRMVYGTDYPIPAHKTAFLRKSGFSVYKEKNVFDADIMIKKSYGMSDDVMKRGYELINSKS